MKENNFRHTLVFNLVSKNHKINRKETKKLKR